MRFSHALLCTLLLNGCQTIGQKDLTKQNVHVSVKQSAFFVDHDQSPLKTLPQKQRDVWDRIAMQLTFPISNDERVKYYRDWYINNPQHLHVVAKRAQPFLHLITEKVEQRNIPLEIALLPIVESSFDQFAYSHGRAAGLWQFVSETAKRFGLEQNFWYDGRRDVVESTDAALDLLEYLHKKFKGNWLHALAAYNTGEGRVFRSIRANRNKGKNTDFWSLKLPKETSGYVPKLIAIADVLKNRDKYGVTFKPIANRPAVKLIRPDVQMDLAIAAEFAHLPLDTLQKLNPAYNRWATSPNGQKHILLPVENAVYFEKNLNEKEIVERKVARHKVKSGEVLSTIAKRYATSTANIKKANSLKGSKIRSGQYLLIPVEFDQEPKEQKLSQNKPQLLALAAAPKSQAKSQTKNQAKNPNSNNVDYVVEEGDSLWSIAKKHQLSYKSIANWNKLNPKEPLFVGKKLIIRSQDAQQIAQIQSQIRTIVYKIQSGDSLSAIANQHNVSVAKLIEWNSLDKNNYIKPGQELTLHIDPKA